ncbi:MAG: hypothetical protein BGO09_10225 [Bacteroidetes bacterium 47-18]|nr:MAG: hypothetical protein BGO09_10225 [Bacteroidetes bacterium 47-18]
MVSRNIWCVKVVAEPPPTLPAATAQGVPRKEDAGSSDGVKINVFPEVQFHIAPSPQTNTLPSWSIINVL